jgi:hypothetical protein
VCLSVLYIAAGLERALERAGWGRSILLVYGNNKFNFILHHQVVHVPVRESCKYSLLITVLI